MLFTRVQLFVRTGIILIFGSVSLGLGATPACDPTYQPGNDHFLKLGLLEQYTPPLDLEQHWRHLTQSWGDPTRIIRNPETNAIYEDLLRIKVCLEKKEFQDAYLKSRKDYYLQRYPEISFEAFAFHTDEPAGVLKSVDRLLNLAASVAEYDGAQAESILEGSIYLLRSFVSAQDTYTHTHWYEWNVDAKLPALAKNQNLFARYYTELMIRERHRLLLLNVLPRIRFDLQNSEDKFSRVLELLQDLAEHRKKHTLEGTIHHSELYFAMTRFLELNRTLLETINIGNGLDRFLSEFDKVWALPESEPLSFSQIFLDAFPRTEEHLAALPVERFTDYWVAFRTSSRRVQRALMAEWIRRGLDPQQMLLQLNTENIALLHSEEPSKRMYEASKVFHGDVKVLNAPSKKEEDAIRKTIWGEVRDRYLHLKTKWEQSLKVQGRPLTPQEIFGYKQKYSAFFGLDAHRRDFLAITHRVNLPECQKNLLLVLDGQ